MSCKKNSSRIGTASREPGAALEWRNLPVVFRTLFYSTILVVRGFAEDLLLIRAVLVHKKDGSSTPVGFRSISVTSVVV